MCKCRTITIQGTSRPITGVHYCQECVESGKALSGSLKALLIAELNSELKEIKRAVDSLALTRIKASDLN
jgi:hypothetical protein